MSIETLPTGNPELNEAIARRMKGIRDLEAARKTCERMDKMRDEYRETSRNRRSCYRFCS